MFYLIATGSKYVPVKGRDHDAAVDLKAHAVRPLTLAPGRTVAVPTGVHAIVARGFVGRLLSRSGLALKGVTVEGGTIDPGFEGEVNAILHNGGDRAVTINDGDRICQFVAYRVESGRVMAADGANLDHLIAGAARDVGTADATRGAEGFGSSGLTDDDLDDLDEALDALDFDRHVSSALDVANGGRRVR